MDKIDIRLTEMNGNVSDTLSVEMPIGAYTDCQVKETCGTADADGIIGSDDEEETEMAKTITAVIAFHHPAFGYYATKFQGGSNPPDCGSFDGIHGIGNPGGLCRACPYNKFGSGGNKSKACKNRHMLYLVREGEIFPVVISLPSWRF